MSDDARSLTPGQERGAPLTIDFEGRTVRAFAGEPVAVALLAAGTFTLARSPKYHRPRGLFCLDGHCGSCAMRVAGRPNVRSCVETVRPALPCERQNAFPTATVDVLAAADWLFPSGMDHHRLMTGTRLGNELFVKVVRRMGGSGTLPDAPPERVPEIAEQVVDVCVVGAGPAGLAAARAAATAAPGATVVVYDDQDRPGGSLLAEPGGVARGEELAAAAVRAGVRLTASAAVLGHYPEDEAPSGAARPTGVLAVATPAGLVRLQAARTVFATGGHDQNLPFRDNDRPGILSARGLGRLVFRWGVRPGRRIVVLSASPLGERLAGALRAAGFETEVIDPRIELVLRARGGARVRGIEVSGTNETGGYRRIARADAVAVAALPSPASELPRQMGAEVVFDAARGGFAVKVDGRGATTAAGVFACGDVTGWMGPEAAARQGERAGRAAAEGLR